MGKLPKLFSTAYPGSMSESENGGFVESTDNDSLAAALLRNLDATRLDADEWRKDAIALERYLDKANAEIANLKHQHKNDEAANKLLLAALDHAKAPMRCIGYINPAAVVPGSAGRIVSEYEDLDGCILPVFVPSANTC